MTALLSGQKPRQIHPQQIYNTKLKAKLQIADRCEFATLL